MKMPASLRAGRLLAYLRPLSVEVLGICLYVFMKILISSGFGHWAARGQAARPDARPTA